MALIIKKQNTEALNCYYKLFNSSDQINLFMPQFLNNESMKVRACEESKPQNGFRQRKVFDKQGHCMNDYESSPSFVTDEHMEQGLYLGDSFTLTSEQSSVSEFGGLGTDGFWEQKFNEAKRQNNQKINQLDAQTSQVPNLQSSSSYNPSIELLSFQSSAQSSKAFVPEIKSLVEQINTLENDLFVMAREYLRMKTFCSAVIVSVRTLLSQEVGKQLEKYMQEQFKNCKFEDFGGNNKQQKSSQKFSRKFSQNLLTKLTSQSLSYSLGEQSKQMSKSVQQIFTLGSSKFKLDRNFDPQSESKKINCKSIEKKTPHNFKKNSSQKDKENVYDQVKVGQKISKNKAAKKSQAKYSQIQVQNMKNQSMKFLIDNYATDNTQSTAVLTPRNFFFNNFLPQKSTIATELLCEVCKSCFQPNEFFQHLPKCSASQSLSSLKSTSNLAFNYTIMMQKLFDMRQEIESQIELLSIQKQKHNQKAERQRLRKKLEEDLEKVSKIIIEKEKQMEIHLSKSIKFRN